MKLSMRTTVDDLVRALRWSRVDMLDAVMQRKSVSPLQFVSSDRVMARRARLKKDPRPGTRAR
jgi:hypothetical protein